MDWHATETGEGMATWFRPEGRYNAPDDGISVEEQEEVGSLLDHYRALAALRRSHPALRTGAFAPVDVSGAEGVYAFTRHAPPAGDSPEEWFLVILNFSGQPQAPGLTLDLAYAGPFTVGDALSGELWPDVPAGEPYVVELPPVTGAVLQLSQP
jgi:glycosidase